MIKDSFHERSTHSSYEWLTSNTRPRGMDGERVKAPLLTIKHDRRHLVHSTNIPRLLPQLAHSRLPNALALVDEAGRQLDGDLVQRRAELPLQQDLGARGRLEDGEDAHAVDAAALGPRRPLRRLPRARLVLVVVVGQPAGRRGWGVLVMCACITAYACVVVRPGGRGRLRV